MTDGEGEKKEREKERGGGGGQKEERRGGKEKETDLEWKRKKKKDEEHCFPIFLLEMHLCIFHAVSPLYFLLLSNVRHHSHSVQCCHFPFLVVVHGNYSAANPCTSKKKAVHILFIHNGKRSCKAIIMKGL